MLSQTHHSCSSAQRRLGAPAPVPSTLARSLARRRSWLPLAAAANSGDNLSAATGGRDSAAGATGQQGLQSGSDGAIAQLLAEVLNQNLSQTKPVSLLQALDDMGGGIQTVVRRSWDTTWCRLQLEGTWQQHDEARRMAQLAVFQELMIERSALLLGLLQHVDESLPGLLDPQNIKMVRSAMASNPLNPAVEVLLPDELTLLCAALYPMQALFEELSAAMTTARANLLQKVPYSINKSLLPELEEDLKWLYAVISCGVAFARLRALLVQRRMRNPTTTTTTSARSSSASSSSSSSSGANAAPSPAVGGRAGINAIAPWGAEWRGDPLDGMLTIEQRYYNSVSPRQYTLWRQDKQQERQERQQQQPLLHTLGHVQQQQQQQEEPPPLRRGGAGAVGTVSFRRRRPATKTSPWLQQQPGAVGQGSYIDSELALVIHMLDIANEAIQKLAHVAARDQHDVSVEITRVRRAMLLDMAVRAARASPAVPKPQLQETCMARVLVTSSEHSGLHRRIVLEAKGNSWHTAAGSAAGLASAPRSELAAQRTLARDKGWAFLSTLGSPFGSTHEWGYKNATPAVWSRLVVDPPVLENVTLTIKQRPDKKQQADVKQQQGQEQGQQEEGPRQLAAAPGAAVDEQEEGSPLPDDEPDTQLASEAAATAPAATPAPATPAATVGPELATALAAAAATAAAAPEVVPADIEIPLSSEELAQLVQQLTAALARAPTPAKGTSTSQPSNSSSSNSSSSNSSSSSSSTSSSSTAGLPGRSIEVRRLSTSGAAAAFAQWASPVQVYPKNSSDASSAAPLLELWVGGKLAAQLSGAQASSLVQLLDDVMGQLPGRFVVQQPAVVVPAPGFGASAVRATGALLSHVGRAVLVAVPAALLLAAIIRPWRDTDRSRQSVMLGSGGSAPTAAVVLQGQETSTQHEQQVLEPANARLSVMRMSELCQGVAQKVQGRMWVPISSPAADASTAADAGAAVKPAAPRTVFQVTVDATTGDVLGCKPVSPDALPLYQELPLSGLLRGTGVAKAQQRYLDSLAPEHLQQGKRRGRAKPGSLALRYRPATHTPAPPGGMAVLRLALTPSLHERQVYGSGDAAVTLALMEAEVTPWDDADSLDAWRMLGAAIGTPQQQQQQQ